MAFQKLFINMDRRPTLKSIKITGFPRFPFLLIKKQGTNHSAPVRNQPKPN
jgi:hypothetical protein